MEYTYKYPRPAVTADCVVMTAGEDPQVLLIERGYDPYKGCWAFPGGFLNMDETTERCAIRELEEETGLRVPKVHQIGAYSSVDRDPRGRTITVAYLAIVDAPVDVTGKDDAAKARWFPVNALPQLAFDHEVILNDAIVLYRKLDDEISMKQDMDWMEKADALESVLSRALLERAKQLEVRDTFVVSLAAAQFYAKVILSICENAGDPDKMTDICMDVLANSFRISANDKHIKLNEDKIKAIKSTIEKNNALIEKYKKEQAEQIAKRIMKVKDSEIN